jgi:hypothetical protein
MTILHVDIFNNPTSLLAFGIVLFPAIVTVFVIKNIVNSIAGGGLPKNASGLIWFIVLAILATYAGHMTYIVLTNSWALTYFFLASGAIVAAYAFSDNAKMGWGSITILVLGIIALYAPFVLSFFGIRI